MLKLVRAKRSIPLRLIWLFTLVVAVSLSTTNLHAEINCSPAGGNLVLCTSHPEPADACETYDLNGYCSFVCQAMEYYPWSSGSLQYCDDHGQHDDEIGCKCGLSPEVEGG